MPAQGFYNGSKRPALDLLIEVQFIGHVYADSNAP
jgi:hypothetical protein